MPVRRQLLRSTAAAVTLLVTGGRLVRAQAADPTAPWTAAVSNDHPDPRIRALGWAILAPNPHNRQPWLVELVGDDRLVLRCELARRLPETDPFDRQITIGLGGFVELMRMAAAAEGRGLEVTAFPEGEPAPRLDRRPVATVRFLPSGSATADPLFTHALDRHTNRGPYDTARAVPAAALAAIRASAGPGVACRTNDEPVQLAALRDLTARAFRAEVSTEATAMESVRLIRLGAAEVAANPDGISLSGRGLDELVAEGKLTHASLADPASPFVSEFLRQNDLAFATAMAHVWLTTPGNSRIDQLAVGRDWLRLHLAATATGIAVQPLSQALQEFEAMAPSFAEMHALLGADGARVQMLGRLGYGPPAGPSPRWPAATRLGAAA